MWLIYINDDKNVWARGLEPIGHYELDTDDNGDHFDDWLIFK